MPNRRNFISISLAFLIPTICIWLIGFLSQGAHIAIFTLILDRFHQSAKMLQITIELIFPLLALIFAQRAEPSQARKLLIVFSALFFAFGALGMELAPKTPTVTTQTTVNIDPSKLKTDEDWKKILTPQQYYILRQAGTEIPFTGALDHETRPGTYYTVGCNEPVFRSEQKYDSGTGWPSFWAPIKPDALILKEDDSIPGESRTEVLDKCGNHLGHVFDDGPQPTGKRYCMNSIALKFVPD